MRTHTDNSCDCEVTKHPVKYLQCAKEKIDISLVRSSISNYGMKMRFCVDSHSEDKSLKTLVLIVGCKWCHFICLTHITFRCQVGKKGHVISKICWGNIMFILYFFLNRWILSFQNIYLQWLTALATWQQCKQAQTTRPYTEQKNFTVPW